jgi:putative endonuclease
VNTKQLGDLGELIAESYLTRLGLNCILKNYRTKFGEVDLIMFDPLTKELVFVEVKYRLTLQFGLPIEAVDKAKLKTLVRCAMHYIKTNYLTEVYWRLDVIAICKGKVTHYKDVLAF